MFACGWVGQGFATDAATAESNMSYLDSVLHKIAEEFDEEEEEEDDDDEDDE